MADDSGSGNQHADLSADADTGKAGENQYLLRTVRSASIVALFVLIVLASYGKFATLIPLMTGFLLAVALFWSWEYVIRTFITPERMVEAKRTTGKTPKFAPMLLLIALVKYPLVGLLFWFLVRVWNTEQLVAFASGFVLLHLVIGLRGLGKVLTTPRKPVS
ncbi:MAG: hypothetical protein OHK0029_16620 [Armatimonadaceae bacterium]